MPKLLTFIRLSTNSFHTDAHSDLFLYEGEDALASFRNAAEEFISSDEGEKALLDTSGYFNWGDAASYIPDEVYARHGLKELRSSGEISYDGVDTLVVENDESLI